MASIEAEPDRDVGQLGSKFPHHIQLFEFSAKLRARADRVLDQKHEISELKTMRRLADAFEKMHDSLFHGMAFVVPGMCDQVLSADGHSADQFTAERLYRHVANLFVGRREVDQVVVMNRQWIEIVLLTGLVQQPDGGQARRRGFPLPWTRRENLERIGAQLCGLERGPLQGARDRRV